MLIRKLKDAMCENGNVLNTYLRHEVLLKRMKTVINEEREERIMMDIIVDAYGPEEQAMGCYYYLEDTI